MKFNKISPDFLLNNEIAGFHKEIKIPWGCANLDLYQTKNNRWIINIDWYNEESSTNICYEKNKRFDNIEDAYRYAVKKMIKFFENHEVLVKINKNIKKLKAYINET